MESCLRRTMSSRTEMQIPSTPGADGWNYSCPNAAPMQRSCAASKKLYSLPYVIEIKYRYNGLRAFSFFFFCFYGAAWRTGEDFVINAVSLFPPFTYYTHARVSIPPQFVGPGSYLLSKKLFRPARLKCPICQFLSFQVNAILRKKFLCHPHFVI